MIYPSILVFFGSGVLDTIMGFVVPKLRSYLRPESFNILTQVVFAACDLLTQQYVPMIVVAGVVAGGGVLDQDGGRQKALRAPSSALRCWAES